MQTATDWPTLRDEAGWYAGDLHAHSGHSDGRIVEGSGQRLRVPPEHVFNAARDAGLDFIALTDHNTTSHWPDVDRLQPIKNGSVLTSVAVPVDGNVTLDVVASKGDWFSLVLRDQAAPTLYSNAIDTN